MILPIHLALQLKILNLIRMSVLVFADAGWLIYKAVEKTKTPDTSIVLSVR